jgi:[phosphatase 2A protein]-leucine-carboxy methyltransferase
MYPEAHIIYHEIDFPTNTAAKLINLQRHPQLYTRLTDKLPPNPLSLPPGATEYCSPTYNIHSMDLRSLADIEDKTSPTIPNLDPSTPTLLLSEMCLIYLPAAIVSNILSAFLSHYLPAPTPVALVLYEPILPGDAFGRTMISNLASRNIHLPTLLTYPELGDQRQRLKAYGLADGAKAADTQHIWRNWVPEEEKERVGSLEMLDEMEELNLLLKHYCVAWGWRDGGEDGVFSRAWTNVLEQGG